MINTCIVVALCREPSNQTRYPMLLKFWVNIAVCRKDKDTCEDTVQYLTLRPSADFTTLSRKMIISRL